MTHQTAEDRIQELERRLRSLEHPAKKWSWKPFSLDAREDRARFAGWAITAFSLITFATGWGAVPVVGFFLSVALIFGLALIISASGLIAPSDSMTLLAQESRAGKKLHARVMHKAPGAAKRMSQKELLLGFAILLVALIGGMLLTTISNTFLQVVPVAFGLIILGVREVFARRNVTSAVILGALTLLLAVAPDPLVMIASALTASAVLWIAAYETDQLGMMLLSGLALEVVALAQTYWAFGTLSDLERIAAMAAAMFGVLLVIIPFVVRRRDVEFRDMSRVVLVAAPVLGLVTFASTGPFTALENLLGGLLIVAMGYLAMAFMGWLLHHRLSYGKYFLTVALVCMLLFLYLVLDPVSVTLVWFILGIGVTATGFILPSYSARMAGLFLLAAGILHYLFLVLDVPQVSGPIMLRDRVWLGTVMGIFLPALALWYQETKWRPLEARLVPSITLTLGATSLVLFFAITYLDLTGVAQSLAWVLVGTAGALYSRLISAPVLRRAALLLLLAGVIKFVVIDLFALTMAVRIGLLVTIAVLVIGFALYPVKLKLKL